jgi:DNA-binding Xre family transcriptional regulator
MTMASHFDFGKGLRLMQAEKAVSSTELARQLNVSRQQVSIWRYAEDGKLSLLSKICDRLDCEVDHFLDKAKS